MYGWLGGPRRVEHPRWRPWDVHCVKHPSQDMFQVAGRSSVKMGDPLRRSQGLQGMSADGGAMTRASPAASGADNRISRISRAKKSPARMDEVAMRTSSVSASGAQMLAPLFAAATGKEQRSSRHQYPYFLV